jgi:hypothetical protein
MSIRQRSIAVSSQKPPYDSFLFRSAARPELTKRDIAPLATKVDVAEAKADMLRAIIAAIALNSAVVLGAMFGLAKLLGH